jgi:carbon storage regulator
MLVITRKQGESFFIDDKVEIVIIENGKDKVKLGVKAPKNVKIMRSELVIAKDTNVEAAKAVSLSKEALNAFMKFKK